MYVVAACAANEGAMRSSAQRAMGEGVGARRRGLDGAGQEWHRNRLLLKALSGRSKLQSKKRRPVAERRVKSRERGSTNAGYIQRGEGE